jgi:long-subunit acyl-CoA synthetase (AMP-forming)
MSTGYYNDPEETKNSFDEEGYFHTGDIGEIGPGGGLTILDRKKSIFKLSQGEYISPEKLENAFQQSTFVEQIWVYGNSLESYPVCVIVPNKDILSSWKPDRSETETLQKLQEELLRISKEQGFNSYEIPRGKEISRKVLMLAIFLEKEPFSAGKISFFAFF